MDLFAVALKYKSEGFGPFNRELETIEKKGRSVSKAFTALKATLITGAVGGFIRKIAVESMEAQKQAAQLNAVLKSTGGIAGVTAGDIDKMASSLQRTTVFGDDAVKSAANLLLTFTNIRGEVFKNTLPAITDLATAMGSDLNSAAIQVGKALNDPIQGVSALQKVGVSFSESQKAVIKNLVETNRLADAQGIILKELNVQFGGSAQAARDTLGGALAALSNSWGDLFVVTQDSSKGIIGAINSITDNLPAIRDKFDAFFSQLKRGFNNLAMAYMQDAVYIQKALALLNELDAKVFGSLPGKTGEIGRAQGAIAARQRAEAARLSADIARMHREAGGGMFGDVSSGKSTTGRPARTPPPRPSIGGTGAKAGKEKSLIPDFEFGKNVDIAAMARMEAIGTGEIDILAPLRKRFEDTPEEIARMIGELQTTIEQGPIAEFREQMGQNISQSLGATLGDALSAGFTAAFNGEGIGGIISAFGKTILAGVGQIFTQLGQTYLTYGIIMKSLAALLPNPFTAGLAGIAIGTALIAMGSALGAVASGGGRQSSGSSKFGGGSSGTTDIVRLKFVDRPGMASNLSPVQPIVINAYGPNDPKTQRWMMESLANARRR